MLPPTIKPFDTNLEPTLSNLANDRVTLKFNDSVLVQKSSPLLYSNLSLNSSIVYELDGWSPNPTNNFPLKNCLVGTFKLVRNAIKTKFIYNVEEKAFDREGMQSFGNNFVRSVLIFGVYNSSSSHIDNRKNNFLPLGEGPAGGINKSTGVAKKKKCINFSKAKTKFFLSLH